MLLIPRKSVDKNKPSDRISTPKLNDRRTAFVVISNNSNAELMIAQIGKRGYEASKAAIVQTLLSLSETHRWRSGYLRVTVLTSRHTLKRFQITWDIQLLLLYLSLSKHPRFVL
jgi:hypothetical protein